MVMSGVLYVAGPYSISPAHCTHAAIMTADAIMQHTAWTPLVPHLMFFWDAVSPKPYHEWIAYDTMLLAVCDGFLRLPGPSSGADREMELAIQLDIPMITFDNLDPIVERTWTEHIKGVLNHDME